MMAFTPIDRLVRVQAVGVMLRGYEPGDAPDLVSAFADKGIAWWLQTSPTPSFVKSPKCAAESGLPLLGSGHGVRAGTDVAGSMVLGATVSDVVAASGCAAHSSGAVPHRASTTWVEARGIRCSALPSAFMR